MEFLKSLLQNEFILMFLIAALGYLFGRITVGGLSLGTSGVLLVALVFGHFGVEVPALVRNFGLITFVASVGLIAGPTFFRTFKEKATAYILLGFIIVFSGFLVCGFITNVIGIPADLVAGMFAGALTSTPGLAAATEVLGDVAATGYGIAYPFGVVGVVLFIQLIPKLLKCDLAEEGRKIAPKREEQEGAESGLLQIEESGIFTISVAIVLGMILAKVTVPLPGGLSFSLGTSGGPLISGLLVGHFNRIGKVSIKAPMKTLEVVRELGLMLFLMGAGTQAGRGFLDVLQEQGVMLFFWGAMITTVPMLVGYFFGRKVFKLQLLNALGSITGGMTSTPALGALVTTAKTSNVAVAYAATYPLALIMMVVCAQLIGLLWG